MSKFTNLCIQCRFAAAYPGGDWKNPVCINESVGHRVIPSLSRVTIDPVDGHPVSKSVYYCDVARKFNPPYGCGPEGLFWKPIPPPPPTPSPQSSTHPVDSLSHSSEAPTDCGDRRSLDHLPHPG